MGSICRSCGAGNAAGQAACGQCGAVLDTPRAEAPRVPAWLWALLPIHVLLSSVLGLAFLEIEAGGAILVAFWSPSLAADLAFIGGTALTVLVATWLSWQRVAPLAVVAAALLTWFTYAISLVLLAPYASADLRFAELGGALSITGRMGIAGLVYGAFAPALVALAARASARPARSATVA